MNELNIDYKSSLSGKKIIAIFTALFLICFCLYFSITENSGGKHGLLFYISIVGAITGLVLLLSTFLGGSKTSVKIDSKSIQANLPGQKSITIEWADVSEISIGVSYIVLHTSGSQKHKKMELSSLIYTDMMSVKNKLTELGQFKNIPYRND